MEVEESCPVCQSDRYLNPDLKLLVSPCFHKMCESCVNRLFTTGPGPCPICRTILKRNQFQSQTFEDLLIEKEVLIRRRVGRFFNLTLQNFGNDLQKYNDYLEESETLLYNLIHDLDLKQTNEKIEKFKQEHRETIAQNATRQLTEDRAIQFRIEREKKEKQLRKEAYIEQAIEQAKMKQHEKQELIAKLATSSNVRKSIMEAKLSSKALQYQDVQVDYSELEKHELEIETEILNQQDFDPMDGLYQQEIPYQVLSSYNDPGTLKFKDPEYNGYRAAGYLPKITYERSIQAAFTGLFKIKGH